MVTTQVHRFTVPKNMTLQIVFLCLNVLLSNGCRCNKYEKQFSDLDALPLEVQLTAANVNGEFGDFNTKLETVFDSAEIKVYKISLHATQPQKCPPFSIKLTLPSSDIESIWDADYRSRGQAYNTTSYARIGSSAPVLSFINNVDLNRFTVATSDLINTTVLKTKMDEHSNNFTVELQFFTDKAPNIQFSEYEVYIRISTKNENLSKSLANVNKWWRQNNFISSPVINESATLPLYSSWYAFHENMNANELLKECKNASELGYKVMVIDDGWNSTDSIRNGKKSFSFSGDYAVESFGGDMKSLVDSIHNLGLKAMLWYSSSFIGENTKIIQQYKDKVLRHAWWGGYYNMDIRFPEVRQHYIGKWAQALNDWDLDGIKVDFLGQLYPDNNTEKSAVNGRDEASLDQALKKYMDEMAEILHAKNPNALIEFRQPYATPFMGKYATMFRAMDCANMESVNRYYVTKLRLISGNTPIHSDMFTWNRGEPVESAAMQFANIIFSVPQLSVKIDSIPTEHREMIGFYTDYFTKNKDLLLFGEFEARGHMAGYPVISSKNNKRCIMGVYEDWIVDCNVVDELHIVNGKNSAQIVLDIETVAHKKYAVSVYNCKGVLLDRYDTNLSKGIRTFSSPPAGIITIQSI